MRCFMTRMPTSVYRYIFNKSYRQQIVVIALTLILLPLAPVPLELQRRILDDAVAQKDTDMLLKLGGFYILAMLVAAGFKFAMRAQRELISANIVRSLRGSVFHYTYTAAPQLPKDQNPADVDEVDEGAVVSMMSSEVEKLGGFAGSAISGPLFEIGTLVFVLGYMFWVEPLVASIALGLYSPQFIIVPYFQKKMNLLAQEKALRMRDLGSFIVDNPEDELLRSAAPKSFVSLVEDILRIRTRYILNKNVMKTINNLLIALGPFGVISYGGYLVIQGHAEIGVILAFVSGLERLGGPIRDLVGSYSSITDARIRYATLLQAFPSIEDTEATAPASVTLV
ncbi:ABC transporter ATP-binding protein [Amylibacter sp. SFDW26]|nr:ABC transporter ATP-binding protein [Amylibacter sp. SFDW26]